MKKKSKTLYKLTLYIDEQRVEKSGSKSHNHLHNKVGSLKKMQNVVFYEVLLELIHDNFKALQRS
jgi:hypothetical protein